MASVAVYFVSKEEYDLLAELSSYDWDWHEQNRSRFHGYIDDTYSRFVEVDHEKGLYRQSIYDFLGDHVGKQIREIDIDRMFEICVISDESRDEEHLARWKKKFKEADPESYLYLEYH